MDVLCARYSHINKNSHSSSRESSSDSDGSSDSESSSFESGDDYCIGTNTYRKEKPLSVGVETAGKQKQCRRLTQASDITHSVSALPPVVILFSVGRGAHS